MSTVTNPAEPGTFPAFEKHADLVRAFYMNRWGVEGKALTRESWALSGVLPDDSFPLTEEGEPDFARFAGAEHLADYLLHTKVWDVPAVVAIFRRLPVDKMEFTAGRVCRLAVRAENRIAAASAADACAVIAQSKVGEGMSDKDLRYLDHILMGYLDKMYKAFVAAPVPVYTAPVRAVMSEAEHFADFCEDCSEDAYGNRACDSAFVRNGGQA